MSEDQRSSFLWYGMAFRSMPWQASGSTIMNQQSRRSFLQSAVAVAALSGPLAHAATGSASADESPRFALTSRLRWGTRCAAAGSRPWLIARTNSKRSDSSYREPEPRSSFPRWIGPAFKTTHTSPGRTALAEAAGTTPDRVAVQCVHQHDAPFVCLRAEKLLAAQDDGLRCVDVDFFATCLDRGRTAVKAALLKTQPVTHIGRAQGAWKGLLRTGESPSVQMARSARCAAAVAAMRN